MGVSGTSSSSSSRSSSTSSASRTSSTSSVSKTATATKATTAAKPTGHPTRDTFSLPDCKVTPVKGGSTSSGTGVDNDVCTFNPRDSWEA